TLKTPVSKLYGIGPSYVKKLKTLGIEKIKDLLYHLPHRYEDFSNLVKIKSLQPNQKATIQGKILQIRTTRTHRKRMFLTEALIEDETGAIRTIWFNQPFLTKSLQKGTNIALAGKVNFDQNGIYFSNPVHEIISRDKTAIHTAGLVPIYPETKGITSRWLRYQIKKLIQSLSLPQALKQVHFPDSQKTADKARHKLAFEELLLLQLYILQQRAKSKKAKAPIIKFNQKLIRSFVKSLPFKLTTAQRKASWEILQDIEKPYQMNRLLEGDVGSGKTIVATIAALETAKAGYQAVFMAPTEILAEQHYQEINKLLKNFNLEIGLVTKSVKKLTQNIIIGTHALLNQNFDNLGLAIVDEQHRFGVRQRARLANAHLLTMTATPIPRTLALTVYGDLDISLLDEMPMGRQKIITKIVAPANRAKTYDFIRGQIKQKRQIFVICPIIEESKILQTKAVNLEFENLKKIFPEFEIALLHGKIKNKQEIMLDFVKNKINIMVATSVVEVGIDVPNATVMMIEGAERFGLAQLHQLRGRVGRGEHQSYCFLLTESSAKKTGQRLKALLECENGFELAEKDLQIRGPGQFLGIRQSGLPDFTMTSLKDLKLIKSARKKALEIFPKLNQYKDLQKKLKEFKLEVHLE
ncbi:MAG: ATP-dependent DNA helicase RecG, partial [bacterium]